MLKNLKTFKDSFGIFKSLVAWLCSWLIPVTIISSATLRAFIIGSVTIGAVLAYYWTYAKWRYVAKDKRTARVKHYALGILLGLSLSIFLLYCLNPATASNHELTSDIHDWLMDNMFLSNLLVSLGFAIAVFFLVAIIVILSPHMDKPSGRKPAGKPTD